jgi:hypothetical protein
MKKALAVALAAALTAGLVTAASGGATTTRTAVSAFGEDASRVAARAARTYRGSFKNVGGPSLIIIKAGYRGGEAKNVKSMEYEVPMNCVKSGRVRGSTGWRFDGVRVKPDRRFSVRGGNGQDPESTLVFKGRFTRNFQKVRGTFKTHQWFEAQGKLPAEYCNLPPTKYVAKR